MLTHSTRRWLAGLGVAGAFVAASASPAAAAEEAPIELGVYFSDTTLAAGSEGKIDSPILYASEPVVIEGLKIRYDYRDLDGTLEVKPDTGASECESPEPGVLVCTDPFEVGLDEWGIGGYYSVAMTPTAKAADGDAGSLTVTVSAEGIAPATHTAKVRIGEGVDLAAPGEETMVSAAPGGTFSAPLTLSNVGETDAKGAVAVFDLDYAIRTDKQYSNCTYEEGHLRTCSFSEETVAGEARSASLSYVLGKDTYAPGSEYGYYNWMTIAEFEDFSAYLKELGVSAGKPGDGPVLTLPAVPSKASARSFQADTDPMNNWSGMTVKVTGKNGVDLVAVADKVAGKAGDVVTATAGVRNDGPAALDFGRLGSPVTKIDVAVPEGTTAVKVPEVCAPLNGDQADWDQAGKPGKKLYRCYPDIFIGVDEEQTVEFGLRIDKVIANATGTVTINAKCECEGFSDDLNPANDIAKLLVNAAGGQGGGDDDGGALPITGQSTGLIAGIGALLLAAGVGGYLVAKRRRTRFVA
ncbi:LPXTG cell wall anchor domain-containing protein [Micromonospora acroterricola]|uniref:LPXTG cell wall anchor domain-containing protein n=1 Tax=Micromonospora acroterricola TaxID=2202421 RepID=A0A317DCN0_9ACTN|nr:LPXTG cell wall anchor domain-containing protein [Micromonospora acroterricola]PWR11880.1 LPXTG cell wall anchor domain-containing protein [Micromonospora acroterricola]